MTRRTFLKSLAVVATGAAAGLSILPTTAKAIPAYVNARYETEVLYRRGYRFDVDPFPLRYRLIDGEWRRAEWA